MTLPHANYLKRMGRSAYSPRRAGMATMIVLLLLSITVGLSYSLLRSQGATVQAQSNSNLDMLARQAAMTGYSTALRKMNDANWGGIAMVVTGSLSANQSFRANYATGDPSITTTSANASDWPYRVTITSLGTAVDPARPTIASTYTVTAVVRLIPRQLATVPTTLTSALQFTVYQYANDTFELQLPCRVTGPVRLQGQLQLCTSYPPSSAGQSRYLSDLNAMRSAGYGDWRPLNGPVSVPNSDISGSTQSVLNNQLGVSNINISATSATGWSFPGSVSTYQLYAGGQTYTVPTLQASLANTSLAPDPRSNPLGLFYRSGSLTIGNNVSISGTVIVSGDVTVTGTGVTLQAFSLPSLLGSTQPVQLPAVVASGSFKVESGVQAVVRGMIAVWNAFDVDPGTQSTTLDFQGRVICKGFQIEERSEWNNTNSFLWSLYWSLFQSQLSPPSQSTTQYYPVWLGLFGLSPTPILTVAPETSSVTYQWKDASNTLYVPGSSDTGLVWSVQSWSESF
ncbi:MAG TPA: hypothetical protein VHZ24_14950 [Pirellulales bacterium]|jgi:hypothetical protein|nr:hypothetical protein [Pirellulales bacterium]